MLRKALCRKNRNGGLIRDVAYGAVGGAVGTVAMTPVTSLLYEYEPEEKRRKEEELRREDPTTVLAARLLAQAGLEPTDERKLMNAVLGLTPPPAEFPVEAHLRGLVGHVVYSAAAEGTVRALHAAFG